ncbi:MAG: YlzJ-like family protein [Bacillota bacterium]|nr:YlzJ-like family protein [Bacillota bacterium]MDI7250394.1 YlzJ-like family protein [Bacillota bacterium]
MLWTPMAEEAVMTDPRAYERDIIEITYRGKRLLVEPVSATEARVVRLISTDPADFLRPDLQPGRVVPLFR